MLCVICSIRSALRSHRYAAWPIVAVMGIRGVDQDWHKGSWRQDQWQSPRHKDHPVIPTPSNFKEDEHHYDTNLLGHLPLKKHMEASAWSRAKGIAGMDIKQITLPHLCRHGLGEFGLRPLSNGKFTGVVLTRSIAESVLLSQISKQLRDLNVDNLPVQDDEKEEVPTSSQKKIKLDSQPKRRRSTKTKEDNSRSSRTPTSSSP